MRSLCKQLGIRDLRPHDLRRTTANKLYTITGDLRVAQAALAHATLRATFDYLNAGAKAVTAEQLEEATK